MKLIVPDYYADFRCIAGSCRHTCCVGWEIDIDSRSLQRYQAMPGTLGERLRSHIDMESSPHFRLSSDERCPFLNKDGLCDLIIEAGSNVLCQICADHPRFRNMLSDREEMGLGLCCEAAARLILTRKESVRLVTLSDDGFKGRLSRRDKHILQKRDLWLSVAQDRSMSISKRMDLLVESEKLVFPSCTLKEWVQLYQSLERLDNAWTNELSLLLNEKTAAPLSEISWEIALEQLLVYFLFRHIAAAEDGDELRPRLAFCLLSVRLISYLASLHRASAPFGIADFCDLARMYSSEIEYSQENTDALFNALWNV